MTWMLTSPHEGPIDLSGIEPETRKHTAELLKEPMLAHPQPQGPWWKRLAAWAERHPGLAFFWMLALTVGAWLFLVGVIER